MTNMMIPPEEFKSRKAAVLAACQASLAPGNPNRLEYALETGALIKLSDRGGGWGKYQCAKCEVVFEALKNKLPACRQKGCPLVNQLEMSVFKAGGRLPEGLELAERWFGLSPPPRVSFIRSRLSHPPVVLDRLLTHESKAFLAHIWHQDIQERCFSSRFSVKAEQMIRSRELDPELLARVSPAFDMGLLGPHIGDISERIGDQWEAACLKKGLTWFPGLVADNGLTLPLWSEFEFPTSFDLRFFNPDQAERKSVRSWGNGLHHVYARSLSDLSVPDIWLVEGFWDYLTALEMAAKIGWAGSVIGLPGSGLSLPPPILMARTLLVMVHDNKRFDRTKEQLSGFRGTIRCRLVPEHDDLNDQYKRNAGLAIQEFGAFLR